MNNDNGEYLFNKIMMYIILYMLNILFLNMKNHKIAKPLYNLCSKKISLCAFEGKIHFKYSFIYI